MRDIIEGRGRVTFSRRRFTTGLPVFYFLCRVFATDKPPLLVSYRHRYQLQVISRVFSLRSVRKHTGALPLYRDTKQNRQKLPD
jgi:hypothetical protein